jgi:hypothetical protein
MKLKNTDKTYTNIYLRLAPPRDGRVAPPPDLFPEGC